MELKTLTFTYTKAELVKSSQKIDLLPILYNKKSYIENVFAHLDSNIEQNIGYISIINNYTKVDNIEFNTSIGTITIPIGRLVFNLSYGDVLSNTPYLKNKIALDTVATYKSGLFSNSPVVKINVQALDDVQGTRVVTIQY